MTLERGKGGTGSALRIVGRSSSHFTRLVRVFAEELGVVYGFSPVFDLASMDARDYAGNPALKLPVLTKEGTVVFGADNICRLLAQCAPVPRRVVWPEDVCDVQARNAQELVWHAMQAQVQLGFGTQVAKLPADNVYFVKAAAGLRNALEWLDERVQPVMDSLPPRDLSMLEASLFCLVEHLSFRQTVPVDAYGRLAAFAREFGKRASASSTGYKFDAPPGDYVP